jgi:uncharacterized protein (TIGR02996 family)
MIAEDVRHLLNAKDTESALDLLIRTWRDVRAVAIAELVELIDMIDPLPAVTTWSGDWLETAHSAKTQREFGALAHGICGRTIGETRAVLVEAQTWHDPRVSTELLKLLYAMPFPGRTARYFWRYIFDAVRAQQDSRFTRQADALSGSWKIGGDTNRFLTNRLKEAIAGHAEPFLDGAETAAIEALTAELRAAQAKPARTEADLLAAIYDHPDDDGPRLVYADWLQERDDARGEFIALQLRGADPKRANAIMRKHKKALLGPIGPVLGADVEFRRGFPAKVTAKFRHQRDVELYGMQPAWATVEELGFADITHVPFDQREWARYVGPAMTNLRRVILPNTRWLLEVTLPWRIEEMTLGLHRRSVEEIRVVLDSPWLPRLRAVRLDAGDVRSWIDSLGGPEFTRSDGKMVQLS